MSSSQQGSRFSEYTATDHQAPLWIATSIALAYTGIFFVVRLAVKYKVLGLDDLCLAVAHVLGIAQWGVMYAALNDGVGRVISDAEQTDVAKLVYISRLLTVLTVGFSECSVLLFLRQLFAGTINKGWNFCSVLVIGTGVWTLASALLVSVSCSPTDALLLDNDARCTGDAVRWGVVTGVNVCLEVMLVIIPILLFRTVQISRSRKITIFGAFAPRILVPAFFIAYLVSYIHFRQHGGTSLDAVSSLVWQQVVCGYGLVSATTPCLRGFLGRFRTEDLTRVTEGSQSTRTYDQTLNSRTNPETYGMDSLSRKNSKKIISNPADNLDMLACRPDEVLHSATAFAEAFGDGADGSVKSFGSDRMMIHRKVEFDVISS